MSTVYLTTKDNPYNPEKDYLSWHNFDMEQGYYSAEYLTRIYDKNLMLKHHGVRPDSPEIDEQVLEDSIDEIVQINNLVTNSSDKTKPNLIEYVKIVRN